MKRKIKNSGGLGVDMNHRVVLTRFQSDSLVFFFSSFFEIGVMLSKDRDEILVARLKQMLSQFDNPPFEGAFFPIKSRKHLKNKSEEELKE